MPYFAAVSISCPHSRGAKNFFIYVLSSIRFIVYVFIIYFLDCNLSGLEVEKRKQQREKDLASHPIPLGATVSIAYNFCPLVKN
jgi:hypothetical protein